jgi:hypothetical protein
MKVFLKKVAIILIVVIGFSTLISAGSLWTLRKSSFYKPSFLVNDVKDNSFDYIILGASTGLTTLNTHVIDSIANTQGLNLSMDDTALSTHYLMLEHFIAEGKTTSYCILAPSNTSYDLKVNRLSDNDYRFLPYIGRAYVYDHYNQYKTKEARFLGYSEFLPVLGVSYYNTELFYPSISSLLKPKKRNRFDTKGNYTYPAKNTEDHPIRDRDTFDVDFSNAYMKAIKTLCERNGIQLICYFTPMGKRYAKVVNTDYMVINHSGTLTNKRYFFDGIHVNSLGREASSRAFAKQFIELKKDQ